MRARAGSLRYRYATYLKEVKLLTHRIVNPGGKAGSYPKSLNSSARRALYDNLEHDEELAVRLDQAILRDRQDDWRGHPIKKRIIRNAIAEVLDNEYEVDRIFDLVQQQVDY